MLGLTQYFDDRVRTDAVYLQDFISVARFRLLLGVRRDDATSTSAFCDLTQAGCPSDPVVANLGSARKAAFSPRAGLAWQPTGRTTAFVSWSRSFNPNTALDRNNRLLPPEQVEAGLRQDLLAPGRLTASLNLFRQTRQNIAEPDPAFPDGSRSLAVGEQRTKGVEVELSGKPAPWLDLLASYAYLDGRVTRSDVATTGIAVGSRLPEATPNTASLFAKAALEPLGLRRVSVSAGVYFVDRRPARDYFGNFFAGSYATGLSELPASTRLDLGAYWDATERVRVQANLTNAFDTPVYEPVGLGFYRADTRHCTIGVKVTL